MASVSPPTDRVVAVLDALAAEPARSCTVSELARRLSMSTATCHAVVAALTAAGYLARSTESKRYTLGPRALALGRAAETAVLPHPDVLAHLRRLSAGTGYLCSVRTLVDDQIVVVDHTGPAAEGVGDHYPFAPPFGLSFVLWGPDRLADEWMARAPVPAPESERAQLRALQASARRRGYAAYRLMSDSRQRLHVALLSASTDEVGEEPLRSLVAEVLRTMWLGAVDLDGMAGADVAGVSTLSAPILDDGASRWIAELHLRREDSTVGELEELGRGLAAATTVQ